MNPSLLLIPDRYKASKLYSQIPDSGAGDLAFTRALDTATRVNSAGLIEKVRTNLALYSQDFTNAAWFKEAGNSATGNTIANPLNGATDADTITATDTNAMNVNQLFTAAATSEHTYSIYLKKNNHDLVQPYIFSSSAFAARIEINLNDGTFTTINGSGATVASVGNGWYRITLIASLSSAATFATGVLTLSATGSRSVYVFGVQVETGVATPYIPTTTAAVSVGPVANIPRIDYTGGGCGKLLLEPQRTNLVTFSEQFDNAAWTKVQSSVTANNAASPDGFINADKFIANTTSNLHFANSSIANTAAPWTYSVFAKAAGYDRLIMWVAGTNFVGFNLTTGIVESTLGTNITSANIQNYGNGWYRCSITSTSTSSGTSVAFAVFNAAFTDGNINPIFTGNGTDGILIYGAQFEAGSYVSSYIPTLGASVTRSADAASKTGISSLIGQTSGTLYVEMSNIQELDFPEITIDDNTNDNRIVLTRSAVNGYWGIFTASAGSGNSAYGTTAGNSGKFALAYSSAGYVLYRNGVQVATATASLPVSLSAIRLNGRSTSDFFGNKNILAAALYTTRLSNAELQTLTTL